VADPTRSSDVVLIRIANHLMSAGAFPMQSVDSRLKDTISQLAVESILVRGPRNLTEIAEYVRDVKGTASRTTIRGRMSMLQDAGIVGRAVSEVKFYLTEKFVAEWWSFFEKLQENFLSLRAVTNAASPDRHDSQENRSS